MKRILKSLNFFVIGFYFIATTAHSNSALETKCATSEKNALISSLQQQRSTLQTTQPQQAQLVDKCIQSIYGAYAACVNTLNSAGATALGAGSTNQMGQLQQYQAQQNLANGASELSLQDKALNDTCVQQYGNAQKACTGFPASSSAQKYASKVQGLCSFDSQQAAANAENFNQIEDAAEQLTPSTQQPASPTAAPNSSMPPSPMTPSTNPGTGYTTPKDLANNSSNFSLPNQLNSPALSRTLPQEISKNEKDSSNTKQLGYGVEGRTLTLAENNSSDNFLNEKNTGSAEPSSPASTLGLLSSDSSSGSEKNANGNNSATDSTTDENPPLNSNPSNSGSGLAFAPLGAPFDISSGPGLEKLMERAAKPNMPIVEKIVPSNALPSKSRYGAKTSAQRTESKSPSLSSLFKNKRPVNERRAPSSIETEQAPDNETQSTSRSLALLLLVLLTTGAGQLYKKFLKV